MSKPILTRTLRRHERSAYTRHLLQLDADDRRRRFGLPCDNARIHEYVSGIDFDRDAVLCVFDDELALIGAAHVARGPGGAEVGVSVLPSHRGRGIGSALMERSRLHARNRGDAELYTFCAADNAPMMRLARKLGMQPSVARGEADARAALPPPDPASHASELISERVGAADYAMKQQFAQARKIATAWQPFQAA